MPGRPSASVLASSVGATEGPVFMQDGRIVVISMDRGVVWSVESGVPTVVAMTGQGSNGLAEGPDGSLYVAVSGQVGRRPRRGALSGISAVRPNGPVEWITTAPVAPNDLCFGPDGLLYFTDPTRGRRDDGRLWRVDLATGEAQLLTSVHWYPNGLGFGLENDALIVADTLGGRMVRFPLTADGLGKEETAYPLAHGVPDGFAYTAAGDCVIAVMNPEGPGDIQTYSTNGRLLDVFAPGISQHYTNVALDPAGRLVITCLGDRDAMYAGRDAGGMVLSVDWPARGLPLHPFRAPTR